jgi:hypothetical protein
MIATHASGTCALIGLLAATLAASGCHTHQRVVLPASGSPSASAFELPPVHAGDDVRVTLRTGERLDFSVEEARNDSLIGKGGRRFPYADITRLEKRQLSKGKTVALVLGISAAAFTFLLLAAFAAAYGTALGSL